MRKGWRDAHEALVPGVDGVRLTDASRVQYLLCMKGTGEFAAMYRTWWRVVREAADNVLQSEADARGVVALARVGLKVSAWPLAFVLSPCLVTQPLTAQTVRGLVLERVTDRPIDLGRIALVEVGGDTVAMATSDSRGFFSVTTEDPGDYRVVVEAFGYRLESAGPFELDRGEIQVVQVNLEPAPVGISGIDVEAPEAATPYLMQQGFVERRKMGFGHFVGPRELDDFRTIIRSTQDVFDRFPGVSPGPSMRGSMGGRCGPATFVDGVRTADIPPLEHLEAIEIYTRAIQVPLQYLWAAQGCGVILYWTKH